MPPSPLSVLASHKRTHHLRAESARHAAVLVRKHIARPLALLDHLHGKNAIWRVGVRLECISCGGCERTDARSSKLITPRAPPAPLPSARLPPLPTALDFTGRTSKSTSCKSTLPSLSALVRCKLAEKGETSNTKSKRGKAAKGTAGGTPPRPATSFAAPNSFLIRLALSVTCAPPHRASASEQTALEADGADYVQLVVPSSPSRESS